MHPAVVTRFLVAMCVRRRAETGLSRANDYSNVVCGRHNKGSKDSSAAPALPWATDASTGGTVLHARGTQSPQRLWTMYLVKRVLMFSNLFRSHLCASRPHTRLLQR